MPISSSSRRTSPVIFVDTLDDRDVHADAGSGGGPAFKHGVAGAEAQDAESLAHGVGAGAARAGFDYFEGHGMAPEL